MKILDGFITCDEIRTAILDLNKNKSPGEDGLTPEFYIKFCTQIVPYLATLYIIFISVKTWLIA